MTCPNCGVAVPPGARFCPSCGTALAVTLLEERRIVTVLFADVVGYTALAEHRDPETVKRIIDGCLQRLVADVVAFGGRVDKLLGDGVLALFGAPVAHEDDAERAVRAALRMQATLREHSAGTPAPLQLRVGVNTGEVLVGALRAGGDYTAMGDVVNMASRLQTSAAPGTVLVGEATFALTDTAIRYERYGDVEVRGRDQALPAWIALEPLALPGSHRRRHHSPLVGRDEELGLLLGGLRYAVSRRKAFLAAIDGEGGVGKSRLVEEVVERVRDDEGVRVLEGSCVPYGESNVWWPLASALTTVLQLETTMTADEIRQQAAARAAEIVDRPLDDPEVARVTDGFCHILNQPSALDDMDPARARQELTRIVIAVFQARLREGPVMVAITDVHWADPSVLQLFEQVIASLAGLPFLLVTTARPDAELAWPPPSGPYATLRLRLDPLDPAASAELTRAILGEGADSSTVSRLFERSGGNPLFLEELATLVADTGSTVLPDSLRALVAARLDQLPTDQRSLLDNAAVLGTSGPWVALEKFGEETGVEATEQALDGLVEAGLLAVEGTRWRFRSESVRDVAYQTLTKAARAQRHSGVASAMEEHPKSSIEDLAHHWATAAEIVREIGRVTAVPRDVDERAVRWLTEAAERATEQMYPRSGYRLANRGVDLLEGQEGVAVRSQRRRLLLVRADASADLRWLAKSRADLEAALATALDDGDRRSTAAAHRLLGEVERLEGDVDRSRVQFDESLRLWRELGDDAELARALRGRGFVEVFGMTPSGAEPFLDEAEQIYTRLSDRGGLAWVEQNRAWASFLSGDVAEAETRLHKAADVMTEIGDRGGLGWAHGLLAYVRFYAGDPEQAMQISQSVLDEARERGDDWAAGIMQALQANLKLWEGRIDEALQVAEQARARLRRLGDGFGEIQALAPMARALAAQGRAGAAMRIEEELDALSAHFGALGIAPMVEAAVAVQLGDTDRALAASIECEEIERGRDRDRGAGAHDITVLRSIALLQAGRLDEALLALDQAEQMRPGSPFGAAAAAFAAVVDRRPDDALGLAAHIAATRGATYLDRIYGTIAEAAAHRQLGDLEECRWALDSAATMAGGSSDIVARAIVELARAALDGGNPPPAAEGELALVGWRRLIRSLAGEAAAIA